MVDLTGVVVRCRPNLDTSGGKSYVECRQVLSILLYLRWKPTGGSLREGCVGACGLRPYKSKGVYLRVSQVELHHTSRRSVGVCCTRVILNCFRHLTDGTFLLMPCLVRASMGKPCRPDLTVGGA
jgi:hypothetical protein